MSKEKNTPNFEDWVLQLIKKRRNDTIFIVIGIVIGLFFQWSLVEIAVFVIFLWSLLGPIASRYLAWPALSFLLFTPFLLAIGRNEQAEEFAVYAYFFLAMAVLRAIIEIRKEQLEKVD